MSAQSCLYSFLKARTGHFYSGAQLCALWEVTGAICMQEAHVPKVGLMDCGALHRATSLLPLAYY